MYRWDVKILVDTAGQRIYKMQPVPETVSNLSSKNTNPKPLPNQINKGQRAVAEKRKVTITAYLIALGKEADGDYHLVLQALDSNQTLIGEIPNPHGQKIDKFPGLQADYTGARKEVDEKIRKPSGSIVDLLNKIKVSVTGIVFFDKKAHGKGHSANDVEIHPILSIQVLP